MACETTVTGFGLIGLPSSNGQHYEIDDCLEDNMEDY